MCVYCKKLVLTDCRVRYGAAGCLVEGTEVGVRCVVFRGCVSGLGGWIWGSVWCV